MSRNRMMNEIVLARGIAKRMCSRRMRSPDMYRDTVKKTMLWYIRDRVLGAKAAPLPMHMFCDLEAVKRFVRSHRPMTARNLAALLMEIEMGG